VISRLSKKKRPHTISLRYWHELDVRISSVLSGAKKPKEALDDIYQAWEQITDRCGREIQKKLYADSYAE